MSQLVLQRFLTVVHADCVSCRFCSSHGAQCEGQLCAGSGRVDSVIYNALSPLVSYDNLLSTLGIKQQNMWETTASLMAYERITIV